MGRLSIRISRLAFFFLCFLFWVRSADAFGTNNDADQISGRVYFGETQQPARGVTVTLREMGGVQRGQVTTDDGGRFEFGDVSRGSYEIMVTASGYDPLSASIDTAGGSGRSMVIYLKKASSEQPAAPSTISAHELSMPQKARDLVRAGQQKLERGKNAKGALEDFRGAVAIAADYYEAHYQIAIAYLALDKRGEAEKSFRRSIDLSNDKYGEPVIGLGTMMLDKGDNAGGEKMIRHGLELSPNSWLGHYELGRACLNENRVADARKAGEQARSLMPSAALVYRLLANVHMREKDYAALLQDIDMYAKIEPDTPAGMHAKAMRAEVLQKIQDQKVASASSPR